MDEQSGLQRLRELEDTIRIKNEKIMEEFYHEGMAYREIRDNELYKYRGFKTIKEYCRVQWDLSYRHVHRLITAAEYRHELPEVTKLVTSKKITWSEATVRELVRIPDKKQAARVAGKVIEDVEKSRDAVERGKAKKPLKLTAATVRKYVDADLGIDRAAKVRETIKKREIKPDFSVVVREDTDRIEALISRYTPITKDEWGILEEDWPGTRQKLVDACDKLASLVRSTL